MAFELPPNISSKKIRLSQGWAYVFSHTGLGQIGRVVLKGHPDGRTLASAEVSGEADDPMTQRRKEIFEPIGNRLIKSLEDAMIARGRPIADAINEGELLSSPPTPAQTKQIATKMFNCEKCGENVGLLIFAEPGDNDGVLEDAARIMFNKIKEFNVPTWIIGEISGLGNPMNNKARIMKVHPKRQTVSEASPQQFNPIMEALEYEHCK